jgi:hypothetical protein
MVNVYDPSTSTWSTVSASPGIQAATRLGDGRVLLLSTQAASIYDPTTGTVSATASMSAARTEYTATTLADGRVLVVGGRDPAGMFTLVGLRSAEIYNPVSGTWTPTGDLGVGRYAQTATLLNDGRVLVAGGKTRDIDPTLASAELYDPATGMWTDTGAMHEAQSGHVATRLSDGSVFVLGRDLSAERYDPAGGTWSVLASALTTRDLAGPNAVTLLPSGRVLLVGGVDTASSQNYTGAEVYDPSADAWSAVAPMNLGRPGAVAVPLADGRVLVAGGDPDATPRPAELLRVIPDTSIDTGPSDPTNATTAHFTFSSSEPSSTYECALDGQPFASCASPRDLAGLAEGSHTFTVRATAAGQADATPATRTWTVDMTPPTTTIDSGPSGPIGTADASFTFSSNEPGSIFACSLDGATPAACSSPQPYTGLADGTHTLSVRATDAAGNPSATAATRSFLVDTTPPTAFGLATPADGSLGTNPRPRLSWDPSSDAGSGLAGYRVTIDGTIAGDVAADTHELTPSSDLGDGSHTWSVTARDAVGNERPSGARTFVIDTHAPTASVTAAPNPVPTGETVGFDGRGSIDATSAITRYEWDLDGDGAFETDTGTTGTASRSFSTTGMHTVGLRVTDAAGHSATASVDVDVRLAQPSRPLGVSINDGARFTNDRNVILTLSWPRLATTALLANDGGFSPFATAPIAPTVRWRLGSTGADRVPKTVYVRFVGGSSGPETYQDDIVLDRTDPQLLSVVISGGGSAHGARAAKTRRVTINVRARDRISGLARMQIARNRARPPAPVAFRSRRHVRIGAKRLFVRVFDRAGNPSRWVAAKRKR